MPSRKLRVAILGASAGLLAGAFRRSVDDGFVGSTTGGVLGAFVASMALDLGLEGAVPLAIFGAVSGFAATRLSDAFVDGADAGPALLREGMGLLLGGAAGALSLDSLIPPELALES